MSHDRPIPARQRGLTFISWLLVLAIATFFFLIGVKMVPTYIENFAIKEVLANVARDRGSHDMSHRQLKNSLLKRFRINGVYDFSRDNIHIKKTKNGTRIDVRYEVRKPVIGNVSVVMEFSESVVIPE